MHPRHFTALLMAALLLAAVTTQTFAQAPSHHSSAPAVVNSYFGILNAGMKSGDFSALATVFAPNATFTRSTPAGVTTVYHGIAAITRFYQSLPAAVPGYQWTTDSLQVLAPTVVLAYEHAGSPPLQAAGRCVHMFTIQAGKIVNYHWVVFFPGTK